MADGPDWPSGVDRLGLAAAGARLAGAVTLVAGGADRLASLVVADAGADPVAERADHLGALVAAVAEVWLSVARVAGDALELSASTAEPSWSAVAVVAEMAECAVGVNEGSGCGLSAADAGMYRAFPALHAQPSAVVASYHRVSELAAVGALLERGGVRAVAAVADWALWAPGSDALAFAVAACAGFALAASCVA